MWIGFSVAAIAAAAFLYVPGYVAARAIGCTRVVALAAAPLPSMALYAVLGIAFGLVGVAVPWFGLAGSALAVAAAAFAIGAVVRRARSAHVEPAADRARRGADALGFSAGRISFGGDVSPRLDALLLGLVAIMGVVFGAVFFAGNLSSPDSILQEYDNVHHLSEIRTFMETGTWSSLSVSSYAFPEEEHLSPFGYDAGFYPSAWHCVCAFVACATGVPVAAAVNAVNFAFSFVVYPMGAFLFMRELFCDRVEAAVLGAAASLCVVAFPWTFLEFGPLYPNLAANALVFPAAFAFLALVGGESARPRRVRAAALLVIGVVGIALAQPNGVFALGALVAPLIVQRAGCTAWRACAGRPRRAVAAIAAGAAAVAVIAALWLVAYGLPFMQSIVSNTWLASMGVGEGLAHVFAFSYGEAPASGIHVVFGILAIAGAVCALASRRHAWLAFSYAFSVVAFVLVVSTEGAAKHLLAGFWYTDPRRMLALMGMFAAPLAALALDGVARAAARLAAHRTDSGVGGRTPGGAGSRRAGTVANGGWPHRRSARSASAVAPAVVVAVAFVLLSAVVPLPAPGGAIAAPLAATGSWVERQNDWDNESQLVLTGEERDFAREANELLPDGAVVANAPNDGSAYLYGAEGMEMAYRYLTGYDGDDDTGETSESRLVRTALRDIASRDDVRVAAEKMGIEYVLLLDQGDPRGEDRRYLFSYGQDDWSGIEGIADGTPGFEVVMSEGDMRLYRIEAA